ncbi:MAG: dihydropteroate synthase [Desulfuromonadales bacterium]|nr:MAG: dihydropteroate synthase [Desulfuromonadales bacterium]
MVRDVGGEPTRPGFWRIGSRVLDLSRPCIMGVLNVTPDSFSDGNRFQGVEQAVESALLMVEEGADIIDVGGESTRPFAAPVSEDEELRRVIPVIEQLAERLSVPVSIDTYKAAVARRALAAGAEIINDISGLAFDPEMAAAVAESGAGLVLMHTRGRPEIMQTDIIYDDLVAEVIDSLRCSLEMASGAGVAREQIVVDPGIGFGKGVAGNLEILRRLHEFVRLDRPILVGTSRKSFIGSVLNRPVEERIFGTAATVALALAGGASLFRVHDVKAMRDVADMAHAILYSATG